MKRDGFNRMIGAKFTREVECERRLVSNGCMIVVRRMIKQGDIWSAWEWFERAKHFGVTLKQKLEFQRLTMGVSGS